MLLCGVTASKILAGSLRLQPHASGHKSNQGRKKEEEEEEEEGERRRKFQELGLVQQTTF